MTHVELFERTLIARSSRQGPDAEAFVIRQNWPQRGAEMSFDKSISSTFGCEELWNLVLQVKHEEILKICKWIKWKSGGQRIHLYIPIHKVQVKIVRPNATSTVK